MTLQDLHKNLAEIIAAEYGKELDLGAFDVSFAANPAFGDFATNAAMVYAKQLGQPPRTIGEHLAAAIKKGVAGVKDVAIAGPGFINLTLTDETLAELAAEAPRYRSKAYQGKEVVAEYSDPNPFKVLHVGHLYTSVVGDAISNLVAMAGGKVHRVNFGGDVGLHVGKTLWAILEELGGEQPAGLSRVPENEHSEWMAQAYVKGTGAYEDDPKAKEAIIALNKRVYEIHAHDDHESPLAQIYWTCREWSYDYFKAFYARIGSDFERYYPESATTPLGLSTVKEQQAKGVYKESNGAVVFEGEPFGLHTRVFINSQGLPTYEAKDVGLIMTKWVDYRFDLSIVITGNDIVDYMKVVLKSIEQYRPELVERTRHLVHGNVKLAGGVKMSSRKGNFLRAVDALEAAEEASRRINPQTSEGIILGAVKYAFLKQRIGPDIIYVPDESVSLEGNSGPYLQYAHARARSILEKAEQSAIGSRQLEPVRFEPDERLLARKITEYAVVLERAVADLMPHHVAGYLYELAQVFNRFYEDNRVMGDARQELRLELVRSYADVLKDGLTLLGIAAPDRF